MEKMWMRSVLTIAVCLSVAACGKKKESSPIPVSATPPAPQAPGNADAKDALPAPKPESESDIKGNPITPRNRNSPNGAKEKNKGKAENKNENKAPKTENTKPDVAEDVILNEASRYSGSADDALRSYLTHLQDKVSDSAQREANLKLAYNIHGARMRLDTQSETATVTLFMGPELKSMTMIGTIRGKKAVLSSKSGLKGVLTCMDQGSTCDTRVVKVQLENATVPVIFRRTNLVLRADFGEQSCVTNECHELFEIFRMKKVKMAKMDSYEVIQGRSAFKILIITKNQELLKFAGPLANPERYGVLNTPVDRKPTRDDVIDPFTGQILSTRLNDALNDVRIAVNDGKGNLNLTVKMKVQENGQRDFFQLGVSRMVPELDVSIEDSSDFVTP